MTRTLLRAAPPSLLLLLGIAACANSSDLPGGACGTCAEVYTNGGIACGPGPAADAWRALSLCACGGTDAGPSVCASQCTSSFCQTLPTLNTPDGGQTCGDCLAMKCSAQVSSCSMN